MAYKALYRTYRPQDFNEIAGQEHITRTFKNALKSNKIAHAYLFSGPRWTGKTSIAKIIAKAVNCEKAPIENPCNECDICRGIDNNSISDVIEIDAASNNGVDEIREIRDKVKYLPGVGKYKVYIIDEVHMLSTGAFNALLKTLEEPPKHVIFILATTEPHKIPATIHSRCQRFDFRGISVPEMTERLHTIIDEENIEISKEAIKVIAESAEGGMRDAISLLDQVVSYSENKVTINDVHAIRGTVSNESLLEVALAIYENDSVKAIKLLDRLIELGKEAPRLVENMIMFYRDMLIFKNTDVDKDEQLIFSNKTFIELAQKLSNNVIFFYIDILNKTQNDMKWTNNARLFMELALIKLVDRVEKQEIHFEDQINSIKKELSQLQDRFENTSFVPSENVDIIEDSSEDDLIQLSEIVEESKEEVIKDNNTFETLENSSEFEKLSTQEKVKEVVEEEQDDNDSSDDLLSLPVEEKKPEKKAYKTYDVRIVEEVLNNGNREEKIAMNKKWFDIERHVPAQLMSYAKWITEGRVVATNGDMIIIQYSNAALCNRMMKPNIKERIINILSDYYQKEIDYLALPLDVWESKSQEFIKKWKQNSNDYITLSEINHPQLKEMPTVEEETDDLTPDSVKQAQAIFGKSSVKVMKGE